MNAWMSLIIFDHADVRDTVAASEEIIRTDLIEFYNDQMDDDDQLLDLDTTLDDAANAIRDELCRSVIVRETYVCGVNSL